MLTSKYPSESIKKEYSKINKDKLLSSKILEFTYNNLYTELDDKQKNKEIIINHNDGNRYLYHFNLKLEDTSISELFLYLKSFETLPVKSCLLWICTYKTKHIPINIINIKDIDWHFILVDNDLEISKHKGLISKLQKEDIIISGGEMYIDNFIYWNDKTGTLYKNMLRNNKILEDNFLSKILIPIFNTFNNTKYRKRIIKDFCSKTTYEYCEKILKDGKINVKKIKK